MEEIGFIEGQIVVFKYTALMLVLVNGHFIQFKSVPVIIFPPLPPTNGFVGTLTQGHSNEHTFSSSIVCHAQHRVAKQGNA